ncbi:hypothetical protein O5O45_12675 [Hahella aquimaris]|uniref:hypothetical protein n=1 Tax=Hahella sp. HNIBRBA332 TaxID=3015983 RepID=UPI00273C4E2E|nr:hypothetical protein [Hahella sp. HNIBRBA332]WLQ16773.1 hypothetical protein O5O45_12675 [Hahella sp. HNIBRBA332]
MNERQFEELNEHLKRVMPCVNRFCEVAGYEYVDRRALGRYPRIRIQRPGEICRWIELWMELDENGDRYERFFDDIPYELSAGAKVEIADGTPYGHRYFKTFVLFSRKPFREVPQTLEGQLRKAHVLLSGWDKTFVLTHGRKVVLGGAPGSIVSQF